MKGLATRIADYGTERYCYKCREWWPDDDEFFNRDVKKRLRSPCKACIAEKRIETGRAKGCCVAGCTQPRYLNSSGRYSSRCFEHHLALARQHRGGKR